MSSGSQISQLTSASSISASDYIPIVTDTSGTPLTQKVSVEVLLNSDGWIPILSNPIYVSATSIRFESIDLTTFFPVGTKIKFTQTTVKYFYVIASAYSGGHTNLTVTGGNNYTVADAAITSFSYSHVAVAYGFPDWFNYTPTITYAGGTTDPTSYTINLYYFRLDGKSCTIIHVGNLTRGSGDRTYIQISLPVNYSGGANFVCNTLINSNRTIPSYGQAGNRTDCYTGTSSTDGLLWLGGTYRIG